MYVVCFNGPPGAGKDLAAEMLVQHLDDKTNIPVRQESLSFPLRTIAYAMTEYSGMRSGFDYDTFKQTLFPQFGGRTGRELMIDVSESFLKPRYSRQIMVEMLIERNRFIENNGLLLIRDSGFQHEASALFAEYGTRNVYVVRMNREGCDFSNDSREWVNHHDSGCSTDIHNNGTLDDLRTEVVRVYGRLVNQMGWVL